MLGTDTFAVFTPLPSGRFPGTLGRLRDADTPMNDQLSPPHSPGNGAGGPVSIPCRDTPGKNPSPLSWCPS
jgi:hypothetical protein